MRHRKALTAGALAASLAAMGCGRTVIDPQIEPVTPASRIKDWPADSIVAAPAPAPQPASVAGAGQLQSGDGVADTGNEPPWYLPYMAAPAPAEVLDASGNPVAVEAPRAVAPASAGAVLDAIRSQVESQRKETAKWSLLLLEAYPEDPKKGGALEVRVDLGLTRLYSKYPLIAFDHLQLEQAVTKLCVQAEIRVVPMPKLNNPYVTYRKENVSMYEALNTMAESNGFGIHFAGVGGRLYWRAKDFSSRESFIREVVNAVFARGDLLDRDVPALRMTPYPKPSETPKDIEKQEKEEREKAQQGQRRRGAGGGAGVAQPERRERP